MRALKILLLCGIGLTLLFWFLSKKAQAAISNASEKVAAGANSLGEVISSGLKSIIPGTVSTAGGVVGSGAGASTAEGAGAAATAGKISGLGLVSFVTLGAIVTYNLIKNIFFHGTAKLPPDVEARYQAALQAGTLKETISASSLRGR